VGHLAAVRNEGWGTTQERMSIAYAVQNLRVNGWFFLRDARFPVAFTLVALIGWVAPRADAGRAAIVVYFGLFFGVTLFFYAGSYDYGADVRYSLATYPPIAILAGLGASRAIRTLDAGAPRTAVCGLLAAAAVAQFVVVSMPIVRRRWTSC